MRVVWEHPQLTGELSVDVTRFLTANGCTATVEHTRAVAASAGQLAHRFGASREAAEAASWLHDISAVVPVADRVGCALHWGVELLPEEVGVPMIVHQKLSAWIAAHGFGVTDALVLSAIRCHTTLRQNAGVLDKVVFVADKIAWDQTGTPPYLAALERALAISLDAGVCVYLSYLWQRRERLAVVHPWFSAAYHELCDSEAGGVRRPSVLVNLASQGIRDAHSVRCICRLGTVEMMPHGLRCYQIL